MTTSLTPKKCAVCAFAATHNLKELQAFLGGARIGLHTESDGIGVLKEWNLSPARSDLKNLKERSAGRKI